MTRFTVKFKSQQSTFPIRFGVVSVLPSSEVYVGDYEVIPSTVDQILLTAEKFLTKDITIAAIPSRYGLITYTQDRIITVT